MACRNQPASLGMSEDWEFRRELRPKQASGLVRLGNPLGDGGYVVPGWVVDSTDVLLTLGIGQEWTFDEDVLRLRPGVSIVGADHTVSAASISWSLRQAKAKHALNRFLGRSEKASRYAERIDHYRRYQRLFTPPQTHVEKAVSSVASPATVTIDELFVLVGPVRSHGVLVSVDIEGGEYDVAGDLVGHEGEINMIVIEFHHVGRNRARFERSVNEIKSSFDIVHVHGNNCAPYNHDLDLPEVLEVTFVHRSLMPPGSPYCPDVRPLPGLDVPNCPGKQDYPLRF